MRAKQIQRHRLSVHGPCSVVMPKDSVLLHFGAQNRPRFRGGASGHDTFLEFSVWVEAPVDTEKQAGGSYLGDTETRTFRVLPTGADWPDDPQVARGRLVHRASAIMPDDFHVFHLYEVV